MNYLSDSAKISISDLENIQETETPPQSPTGFEEVKIEMSGHKEETTILYTKKQEEEIKRRESEGMAAVQEQGSNSIYSKINRIYHWSLMQTEKSQPEGKRIVPETRFTEFPALFVDPRVGISRSSLETHD